MTLAWSHSTFVTVPLGRVVDVQLGKMLQPEGRTGAEQAVPYLRAGLIAGSRGDLPQMFASSDDIRRYGVREGDVLVAEGGDVGRAVFAPPVPDGTILQNSLHRLRGDFDVLRFVRYCLEAVRDSGWLDVLSNRATFGHLTREKLTALQIPWPAAGERRAIADFLDAETTRIDALIEKRRAMVDLVLEREQAELLGRLTEGEARKTLRQCGVRVCTGPFGTQLAAEEYVEAGVPIVNPSHIRDGEITPEPGAAVPSALATSRLARHQLRLGDIVMGRKGDVGRAALVTEREEGWVCGSDSIAIRTEGSKLSPAYLATVLHVAFFRQELASRSTGATLTNVNESNLLALQVPALTWLAQMSVASQCHQIRNRTRGTVRVFTRQIALLQERRQALITAAVTGELDVPKGAA